MILGSWCSKSSLAKAAGAEVAVPQTDEKWHATVARSKFSRQNAQNTTISEQFSKFTCPKMVCHCGAKHICKSKCTKHHAVGKFRCSKNGTPLWREAHFQFKMHKTPHVRTTFWRSDVQKLPAAEAPSTCVSQYVQNTCVLQNFERFLTD